MRAEMILRIMELNDVRWKFELKIKMSDDEIRRLLNIGIFFGFHYLFMRTTYSAFCDFNELV